MEVSGDGSTAVICDIVSNWWTAINVATGSETLLYPRDFNSAGPVMPFDGSRVILSDDGSHRGHLIRSDGTDGIDLFPSAPIYIGATYSPQISADGSRVAFVHSTLGETAPAYPDTFMLTVRVSAQDDDGHVYVRDVKLFICPPEGCAFLFADGFEGGNTSAWNSVAP